MRICHVVGDSQYGGGSRIVLALLEAAVEAGHEVWVVATNERFQQEIAAAGGHPVALDCVRRRINPIWDLRGWWRLFRHFRHARYDLVHTHTSKGGMVGRTAAWLARVPSIVHTVHGFAFHEESRPAVVGLIALIEKCGAVFCDRLVTVSRFHRRWALELGIAPAPKVEAIPNGITPLTPPSGFDRDAFRAALGLGPKDLMLLGLGRLAPQKGFGDLLDATVPVAAARPDCRVLIAGTGPLADELAAQRAALGLGDQVSLLGFRSDITELYLAADIVVQPSLWEGLSISLLEALSLGRPVVTTTINSNLEVLTGKDAAVLVPPKDPQALAAAVLTLADEPQRRLELGARARSLFLAGYTPRNMTEAYLALYRQLNPGPVDA